MERGADDDGTLAGLPWASVFDPAANLRALGEIQRRGVRAAGEVVDRLVRSVDGERVGEDGASLFDGEANQGDDAEFSRLTESWTSLLQRIADSFGGMVTSSAAEGEPTLRFGPEAAAGVVRLEASGAGAARAEIWLHNPTAEEMPGVALRGSDLLSNEGSLLQSAAVSFEPVGVVPLPPRSSRGIDVVVEVPSETTPGIYRGTLLVQDHPDVWLPVVLTLGSGAG